MVWVALSMLAVGGGTGGLLGFWLGGGATAARWFTYGLGIGVLLGLILLPNAKPIIRWWKGIRNEIKK